MNAHAPARPAAAATIPASRPLVAHVVYRFDVGGLENGVANLVNHFPDRYDHVIVALTEVTGFRDRVTRERVGFHALHKAPGHGVAIYRDLYRLFRRLAPSIVHTRNIAASEAHLAAALAGVPVRIHGEHGWEVHDVGGGKWTHHLQRRLLRPLIHRHVALSGEIRRYLETRVGVPSAAIVQIRNGVDVGRFVPRGADAASRPRALGLEPGTFVVGTVGRLSPVKHQRLLVDAFARACALVADGSPARAGRLRLVVAGDGPDRAALAARVAASGVADRIHLIGARNDVPALLADLDLFVLPSLAEGISNTILEAMACGLPVVATRVGGNAELVDDGVTGTLVPSDDVDAMAAVLRDYALDPATARSRGDAARRRALADFGIDTMVARYADLYDGLLDARRGSGRTSTDGTAATAAVAGPAHR